MAKAFSQRVQPHHSPKGVFVMPYQYCLFDLDGTLTDSGLGITKSVRYALNSFGIDVAGLDALLGFVGPPLREAFMEFYGFSRESADRAVAAYREYYTEKGIFENVLYPGVTEMLCALRDSGRVIALATSKPTVFAETILAHFRIGDYFTAVVGSELGGERSRKDEVIRCVLESLGGPPAREAVMVGDRKHDIIGARETDTGSIGVTYGFGSREELVSCGAKVIVRSVAELTEVLLCNA